MVSLRKRETLSTLRGNLRMIHRTHSSVSSARFLLYIYDVASLLFVIGMMALSYNVITLGINGSLLLSLILTFLLVCVILLIFIRM
jgi:cytochrome c oxidase subunit IV